MAFVKYQLTAPQVEDANGDPLVGGSITAYLWDTSTPTPMYTNAAGDGADTSFTLNTLGNPQTDAGTAIDIFLDTAITYKFIIRDSAGTQVGPTIGPVYPAGGTGQTAEFLGLEEFRASSFSGSEAVILAANAGTTTGRMILKATGTSAGTPTLTAARFTALAAGEIINEGGYGYELAADQQINQYIFGAVGDGVADDYESWQNAVNYCQLSAAQLVPYPGVHRITQTIEITSAVSIRPSCIAGPRVYANPAAAYGGCEIYLDVSGLSTADRTLKSSYCIAVDTGTVGAEGFARVEIERLGLSWADPHAGGIYVEGAVDVNLRGNWITGGLTAYSGGTLDGFSIYFRDGIVSSIEYNTFKYIGYGVVGEELFNENVIRRNNFDKCYQTAVLLRGSQSGIRGSIKENNIIDAEYGVVVVGECSSQVISENTFELIRRVPVRVTNTDPISSSVIGVPRAVSILDNAFIACSGSAVGPLIQYIACVTGVVSGNESRSPTANTNALVNVGSTCERITVMENDYGSITHVSGDLRKVLGVPHLEGEFTPTITFGSGSTGITYSVQVGRYAKVGNLVHVQGQVAITAVGSSTGSMAIGGLPFASRNVANMFSSVATHFSNLTGVSGDIQAYIAHNSTVISLSYLGTGAQTTMTHANATATTGIIFQASYLI